MSSSKAAAFAILLLFFGCGKKPIVRIYDRNEVGKIECLAPHIYPDNMQIEVFIKGKSIFSKGCDTFLYIEHRENIRCNSNQNSSIKALSQMPHNFLRMEVKRGSKPIYSYYIDLDAPVDEDDLERAFMRLNRDLKISR